MRNLACQRGFFLSVLTGAMLVFSGCGGGQRSPAASESMLGGLQAGIQSDAGTVAVDPEAEDCYGGDAFICEAELEVARLTNAYRAQSGLGPLEHAGRMGFVSRGWSRIQADRGSIGHDGFPSARNQAYQKEFGSMDGRSLSAENVAMFYPAGGMTAKAVAARLTSQWWNSSGHRANMLGGHAGLGVGIVISANGGAYGTQIFYRD